MLGLYYLIFRKYSWGICNIENPDHCEFSLFCNIILGYLSDQLIDSTY
jgi:septin family protein